MHFLILILPCESKNLAEPRKQITIFALFKNYNA